MPSLRDLRAMWLARPATYSRLTWAPILALHRLPWPWGEEILARGFVARAFVRTARWRQAPTWAAARTDTPRERWRLARSLCANHGRFVARSALVGIRDPEALRRLVAVRGDALPPRAPDPGLDLDACRRALGHLLGEHVRRYPDHCYSLAFPAPPQEVPSTALPESSP